MEILMALFPEDNIIRDYQLIGRKAFGMMDILKKKKIFQRKNFHDKDSVLTTNHGRVVEGNLV